MGYERVRTALGNEEETIESSFLLPTPILVSQRSDGDDAPVDGERQNEGESNSSLVLDAFVFAIVEVVIVVVTTTFVVTAIAHRPTYLDAIRLDNDDVVILVVVVIFVAN